MLDDRSSRRRSRRSGGKNSVGDDVEERGGEKR